MKKSQALLVLMIILIAFISRFAFYSLKPLHSDESVLYLFGKNIIEGRGFNYSPVNYHGPLYPFMTALSFLVFGVSEFSLKFFSLIFGAALIIVLLFLKFDTSNERFDKYGKYISALFILVSPSILYYSRYAIMEIMFVFFSFLAVYFFIRIVEEKRLGLLPYFAACSALTFSLKETAIFMAIAFFVMFIFNVRKIGGLPWKKDYKLVLLSIVIFSSIILVVFTSFFSNPQGISDFFRGFFFWGGHGTADYGHTKPFFYYTSILLKYEFPLVILSLVGIIYAFLRKNSIYKYFVLWFIAIYLIYSFIPYKAPWLIINISLPMCFLSGIAIIELYETFSKNKVLIAFILIISIIYLLGASILTSFVYPWQSFNKYAYVHTNADVLNLVDKINSFPSPCVLIVSRSYWPLPFYLRNLNVSYIGEDNLNISEDYTNQYNLYIFDESSFPKFNSSFTNEGRYVLRDGVNLVLAKKR